MAVAEALNTAIDEKRLVEGDIYYMGDKPYNERLLFDNRVTFVRIHAGKIRRYFSLLNIFDIIKTLVSVVSTFFKVFKIYPDVIFSKGGYVSFPPLVAARLLGIPVIIHESDSVPGRTNMWAAKFAERIAISYPQASVHFPADKLALTGNPIRKSIIHPIHQGAEEFLGIDAQVPTILIEGGSQGSLIINENLMDILPTLVSKYFVIHQTGKKNYEVVREMSSVALASSQYKNRYKPYDYLNDLTLSMAAAVCSLVVSRAGSSIFEIAIWGLPSIIIPITDSNGDHQRQNAFNYARAGAATVIEEVNLTPHVLLSEIDRLIGDAKAREKMIAETKHFAHPDAAHKIAEEIIRIGLTHEK